MAVVSMQGKDFKTAKTYLDQITENNFVNREYLYYATLSDYYYETNHSKKALSFIELALGSVTNRLEKEFLEKKKNAINLSF
jgi:RNA polymerase sigma-70 factor (ECF subfamily)